MIPAGWPCCTACGTPARVIDSRPRDGGRWRRLRCTTCSRTWELLYPQGHQLPQRQYPQGRLSEAQVVEILTSDRTIRELAHAFGTGTTLIQDIRSRQRYARVRPDLPPWQQRQRPAPPPPPPRCFDCSAWLGLATGCGHGLQGPAGSCPSFLRAPDDD